MLETNTVEPCSRSRMTTAVTFSRQNDACSRASTTQYWENLVLVVVLVLESKALYYGTLYHEEVLPEVSLIMLRTIRWNLLTLKTPISTCYVKEDTLEPINPKSPNFYVLL